MRLVLAALAALLIAAPAALAHKGNPNYLSQITSITPAASGLSVTVVNRDDRLMLRNESGKDVVVEGYSEEPYARIAADGTVLVNTNSPAYYLNEDRLGTKSAPDGIENRPPEWKELSRTGRFEWHDHRAHWMGKGLPPHVTDQDVKTKVFDWSVPLEVGGERGAVAGTLFWTPTTRGGVPTGAIVLGGVLIALIAGGSILVRRRRRTGAGESEAW